MPHTLDRRLRAGDLFESLGNESEREKDREIELRGNPGLERIIMGFESALKNSRDLNYGNFIGDRYTSEESKRDIERFCILLNKYQDILNFGCIAGNFLSSLINKSPDMDFNLNFGSLYEKIHFFGELNKKNIIVNGDLGNGVGTKMNSGSIVVNGNVEEISGFQMSGGIITINGDVSTSLGHYMKGGKIIVYGNVEYFIGSSMENGEIRIYNNSDIVVSNNIRNGFGNLYHNDKPLVLKGIPVKGARIKWL